MGRKLAILALTGLLLTVVACSYSTGASEEENRALDHRAIRIAGVPLELSSLADACIEKVQYANKDAPFVCPAIIEHNSFHRGYIYSWDTVIYSGNSNNATFTLSAIESFDPRVGYVSADEKLLELIVIQDYTTGKGKQTSLIADFKPYETKVFKVSVEIPKEMEIPPKWEFRIRVKDTTQGSNIQVAIAQRCLIDVKD